MSKPFFTTRSRLAYALKTAGFKLIGVSDYFDHKRWYFERGNDARMTQIVKDYYDEIGQDVPVGVMAIFEDEQNEVTERSFSDDWDIQRDRVIRAQKESNRHRAAGLIDTVTEFCRIDYQHDDRIRDDVKKKLIDFCDLADRLIYALDHGSTFTASRLFESAVCMADDIAESVKGD